MRLFITSLILTCTLVAQSPVRPPDRDKPNFTRFNPTFEELKTYLSLTDDQLSKLKQMQQDKVSATQAFYTKMADKQKELNTLLETGPKDATQVGQLMIDLQQMRKQPPPSVGDIRDRALAVLNADQKMKLAKIEEAQKLRSAVDQALQLALITPLPPGPPPVGPRP